MSSHEVEVVCATVETAAVEKVMFRPGESAAAWGVLGSRVAVAAIAICDHAHPSGVHRVRSVSVAFTADQWVRIRVLAEQVASLPDGGAS
jgi:hypothetical protein